MITICNYNKLYVTITLNRNRKENIKMDNKQTVNEYKIITSQNVKLETQNNNHRPNVLEITLYS